MYNFITTAITYLLIIAIFAVVAGFVYLIVKLVRNNGTYKNWYWINSNGHAKNVRHHLHYINDGNVLKNSNRHEDSITHDQRYNPVNSHFSENIYNSNWHADSIAQDELYSPVYSNLQSNVHNTNY